MSPLGGPRPHAPSAVTYLRAAPLVSASLAGPWLSRGRAVLVTFNVPWSAAEGAGARWVRPWSVTAPRIQDVRARGDESDAPSSRGGRGGGPISGTS